jgi:hypothetical protein
LLSDSSQINVLFYSRVWALMPAGALIIFSVDLWHPLAFPSSQIGDLISNPQHIQL